MAEKSPSPEIIKLQKKFDSEPDSLIFARLADAYLSEDLSEKALEIAKKGVLRHPDYISGLMVLGKCYEKCGNENKALDTYISVLDKDRENLLALQKVGKGAYKTGRYEKALDSYKKLLELTPFDESLQQIVDEIEDIVKKKSVREQMKTQMEKADQEKIEGKEEETEEDSEIFTQTMIGEEETDLDIDLPIEKTIQIDEIFGNDEEEYEKPSGLPGDSVMDSLEEDISLELEVEKLEKELEESIEKEIEDKEVNEICDEKDDGEKEDPVIESKTENAPQEKIEEAEEKQIEEKEEEPVEDHIELYNNEIESVTMANIYETQGNYGKALSILEKLLPQNPDLGEDIERIKKAMNPPDTEREDSLPEKAQQEEREPPEVIQGTQDDISSPDVPAEEDDSAEFDQVASETLEELKKIEKHMSILSPVDDKTQKEEMADPEKKTEYEYNQKGLEAFKDWLDKIE